MTDHQLLTHAECSVTHCVICDGGLKHCTVCEGTESSLPTECPGKPMTDYQEVEVSELSRDFIRGKWRNAA